MKLFAPILASSVLEFMALPLFADQWPAWRGPAGTGISPEKNLPLRWSPSENVRWHIALPERGNSSPIVWGDKVFVTQAVSDGKRRTLMCFDRADGRLLWQSGTSYAERESTQRDNPYCTATPVTDGERVIAFFGSAGLYSYDFAGKELWHRDLGRMEHMFGNGASPMLAGDLCILNFGPDEKARLIAVDKRTGETVWEARPLAMDLADMPARGRFGGERPGPDDARPGNAPAADQPASGGGDSRPLLLRVMLAGADRQVPADEISRKASGRFSQLDRDAVGKVERNAFVVRIGEVLRSALGPEGRTTPGRSGGPELFAAADANKDGTLTREEWLAAFARWAVEWDKDKSGSLDEGELGAGLTASLPAPPPEATVSARPPEDSPERGGFRPGGGGPGRGGGGRGGGSSWSTPVLVTTGGHEELIISWPGCLAAYEPKTGRQLWLSKGLGATIYTSPVVGAGHAFATTSGPGGGNAIAVKVGGAGDVTQSQRVWQLERFKSGIGSGVIYEGNVYTISQDGVAACTDLKNGAAIWEERLRGTGSRGSSWSSMLLADGKIYVPNQSGDVFVLRATPKFEMLATNSVGEPTNASLAASNDELFLRTNKSLWCFGTSKK